MKRCEFLKPMTALTAARAVSAPVYGRRPRHNRATESGPNSLDIHGVGTNVWGYEVLWNCYHRLSATR
jgi:peptide/nickel transport system substrate-binding protein